MSQSTLIAGTLILAFVFWVIVRGEANAYKAIFTTKKK